MNLNGNSFLRRPIARNVFWAVTHYNISDGYEPFWRNNLLPSSEYEAGGSILVRNFDKPEYFNIHVHSSDNYKFLMERFIRSLKIYSNTVYLWFTHFK
jgi:hypothetical protein